MPCLLHPEARHFSLRWLGTLLGMALACTPALAADNSLGKWTLNLEKSKYSPSPLPIKSLTTVRESVQGGVKVTVTGQLVDGTAVSGDYTAKYDGKEAPVSGTAFPCDRLSVRQLNDNTFTSECRSTRSRYSASKRIQVSTDSSTMYVVTEGTDAQGRQFSGTLVFERK
jgi:hypothetical protein